MTRFQTAFAALILVQAGHSVEEYVGRLWESFPPARFLTALVSQDHEQGFVVLNVALIGFGLWCLLWTLRQGGYTPGVASAPALLLAPVYLARQLRRVGRPASAAPPGS